MTHSITIASGILTCHGSLLDDPFAPGAGKITSLPHLDHFRAASELRQASPTKSVRFSPDTTSPPTRDKKRKKVTPTGAGMTAGEDEDFDAEFGDGLDEDLPSATGAEILGQIEERPAKKRKKDAMLPAT